MRHNIIKADLSDEPRPFPGIEETEKETDADLPSLYPLPLRRLKYRITRQELIEANFSIKPIPKRQFTGNAGLKMAVDKDFFEYGEGGIAEFKKDFVDRMFTCQGLSRDFGLYDTLTLSDETIIEKMASLFGIDTAHAIIAGISQGPAAFIPFILAFGIKNAMTGGMQITQPDSCHVDLFRSDIDEQIVIRFYADEFKIVGSDNEEIFPGPVEALLKLIKKNDIWGFEVDYVETDNLDIIKMLKGELLSEEYISTTYCIPENTTFNIARINLIKTLNNHKIDLSLRKQATLILQEIDSIKESAIGDFKLLTDLLNKVQNIISNPTHQTEQCNLKNVLNRCEGYIRLQKTSLGLLTLIENHALFMTDYTSEGLPFQITLNKYNCEHKKKILQFIQTHLVPLIDSYAEELSANDSSKQIIHHLLQKITSLQETHLQGITFDLAIAINYEKNKELYCAGVEVSSAKLALRKSSSDTQPLTQQLSHVRIFSTSVNRGDAVFSTHENEVGTITIPSVARQKEMQQRVFGREQAKLNVTLEKIKLSDPKLYAKGKYVQRKAYDVKAQESSPILHELTRHIIATHRAIQDPNEKNLNELNVRAENAQGKASLGWKALGIATMAFGGLLMIFGGLVILASAPAIASPACPVGIIGVGGGAAITGAGLFLFATGLGFFNHGKQKGLSKAMSAIPDEFVHRAKR